MTRTVYTIPPDIPFLRALAQGLAERAGGYTPELAKMLVLLPTRRAARGLRDAFLDLSKGKPLLLPRMQPLGDVDQDELDLRLAGLHDADKIPDIPPAIPSLRRLLILSRMIRVRDSSVGHEQALKMAGSLATLIDQVHTEDLDFSRLTELVPSELSEHWKQTLVFLDIVTTMWPKILEAEGLIDPADRRNRLMKTLANSWAAIPPIFPIIAAGSTGSIPATARLLDVVSTLPQGAIILPGLDQILDEASWDAVTDTHPQATMKTLLKRMDMDRRRVEIWPTAQEEATPRPYLAREMMRPAETVHEWAHLKDTLPTLQESLTDLHLVETKTQSEEAHTIAVIMRATLEEPGKTATLVTPDRALARRVCAALQKWDIPVDDSAGSSLAMTPAGHLLTLIMECVSEEYSPAYLLNLSRHQSVRLVETPIINLFDMKLCRGPRPAGGLNSLRVRLQNLKTPQPLLNDLLERIETVFAPLQALARGEYPAETYLAVIANIVEALAGDAAWQREDGEAANLLIAEFDTHAGDLPPLDFAAFDGMLRQLMQTIPVRHPVIHPRLLILGQLEARMIQTDVMICGSLNEGSWPAEPGHDPWMSRPMRAQFGLPSPERSIGLAAHDFVQSLCSPRVIITRSLKVEGSPTVPSRWLQRLETMLAAAGLPRPANSTYAAWANSLQHIDGPMSPAQRPNPCPPVAARPDKLSATWIERWMKNPYQVYVRKILNLSPLTPIDQDTTAAERGSVVHAILKDFLETYPDHLPPQARNEFIRIARRHMDALETDPAQREYWWPRIERLADWFITNERDWRTEANPWKQEVTGEIKIPFARGQFTLFARADRIDRLKTGGAAIIDYKTGSPPSLASITSGDDCQVPLEGLILRHGGFDPDITEVALFSYWKLLGSKAAGETKDYPKTSEMIDTAEEGLRSLIAVYEDPNTPYAAKPPKNPNRIYDDERAIQHLARTAEWGSLDDDDAEAQG